MGGKPKPIPTYKDQTEIEKEASCISVNYSFDPLKTEVRELAKRISGENCVEVLSVDCVESLDSGSLKVYGPNNFKIYLSPITSGLRDNFTIAHELGHYFLHSGTPPGTNQIEVGRSGNFDIVEHEANRFAAELLMPRQSFGEAFKKTGGNTLVLSGLFNVSRKAVEVRIESLRLK